METSPAAKPPPDETSDRSQPQSPVASDHADPTLLEDGDDYYMTFSSFDAYPGIVNWWPITAALTAGK